MVCCLIDKRFGEMVVNIASLVYESLNIIESYKFCLVSVGRLMACFNRREWHPSSELSDAGSLWNASGIR